MWSPKCSPMTISTRSRRDRVSGCPKSGQARHVRTRRRACAPSLARKWHGRCLGAAQAAAQEAGTVGIGRLSTSGMIGARHDSWRTRVVDPLLERTVRSSFPRSGSEGGPL
jgi:hypothetical protein